MNKVKGSRLPAAIDLQYAAIFRQFCPGTLCRGALLLIAALKL